MSRRGLTPSQTVGPFFHPTLLRDDVPQHTLATPGFPGERIRIEGRVRDGEGAPTPDAMIEIWQADAEGRYGHPRSGEDTDFTGFARSGTDDDGRYWFDTIRPGRAPLHPDEPDRLQASHICLTIFARGLLHQLHTRLYFEDDPANDDDPILALVPENRRGTLLARRSDEDRLTIYRLDIILQGEGETVFFNPRTTARR